MKDFIHKKYAFIRHAVRKKGGVPPPRFTAPRTSCWVARADAHHIYLSPGAPPPARPGKKRNAARGASPRRTRIAGRRTLAHYFTILYLYCGKLPAAPRFCADRNNFAKKLILSPFCGRIFISPRRSSTARHSTARPCAVPTTVRTLTSSPVAASTYTK